MAITVGKINLYNLLHEENVILLKLICITVGQKQIKTNKFI